MSFGAYCRLVENWEKTVPDKFARKAHLLLKDLQKDDIHEGLKEMINSKVNENLDFDLNSRNVIRNILDLIEKFVGESIWSQCANLVKEVRSLKQSEGQTTAMYIAHFESLESKLKNAKTKIPNIFLANLLLEGSNLQKLEKENVLSSVSTDNEEKILDKVKNRMRDLKA